MYYVRRGKVYRVAFSDNPADDSSGDVSQAEAGVGGVPGSVSSGLHGYLSLSVSASGNPEALPEPCMEHLSTPSHSP